MSVEAPIRQKIAIVLPTLGGGGAERLHLTLAQEWLARGFTVEFVLLRKVGELLPLVPAGATVVGLEVPRLRSAFVVLRRYLRMARPTVTIAAMWPLSSIAILAWRLARSPGRLFVSDHSRLSIAVVREMNQPRWLLATVIRMTYPFASGVIAVSNGVRDDLSQVAGLSPASISVIYNPAAVGLSELSEDRLIVRARLWREATQVCFLSVGTLKDHVTLIRAFAQLSRNLAAKLIILGDGPLRQALLAQVEVLGLEGRVELPGFQLDPQPWYQTADVFVLSSAWEGFGNVIVEALEAGIQVVSTDCPSGPAEILDNGRFGRLVPVGDVAKLAAAMQDAATHPIDPNDLRQRATAFAATNIAERYLTVFGLT
jgi:glycosyltransferase involved in cell wall biosynthesis